MEQSKTSFKMLHEDLEEFKKYTFSELDALKELIQSKKTAGAIA